MKVRKKLLVLSFMLVLLTAVGCTGEKNNPNNTTGGGIGANKANSAAENYDATNRYSFDRYNNDYTTPYNTNYITNNTHATSGGITGQNNNIESILTNR